MAIALLVSACNPTRKLKESEHLLVKNEIIVRGSNILDLNAVVDKGEIESYVRQKPNRKIGPFRLHLMLYNSVNEEKLKKKKIRRDARIDKKNERKRVRLEKRNLRRQKKTQTPEIVKTKKQE